MLIGLTKISLTKSGFDHPSVKKNHLLGCGPYKKQVLLFHSNLGTVVEIPAEIVLLMGCD
jgi:hypothetical protein